MDDFSRFVIACGKRSANHSLNPEVFLRTVVGSIGPVSVEALIVLDGTSITWLHLPPQKNQTYESHRVAKLLDRRIRENSDEVI